MTRESIKQIRGECLSAIAMWSREYSGRKSLAWVATWCKGRLGGSQHQKDNSNQRAKITTQNRLVAHNSIVVHATNFDAQVLKILSHLSDIPRTTLHASTASQKTRPPLTCQAHFPLSASIQRQKFRQGFAPEAQPLPVTSRFLCVFFARPEQERVSRGEPAISCFHQDRPNKCN